MPDENQTIEMALNALGRLMNLFRYERFLYLIIAVGGFGLAVWAAILWIQSKTPDSTQVGLMFGATGAIGGAGGMVTYYLKRSFDIVEALINRLSGDAR